MHADFSVRSFRFGVVLAMAGVVFSGTAISHELGQHPSDHLASSTLAVSGKLPPLTAGVTDLKFREMFKFPIGPRGLEPSDKLIGLNDKRVRMLGYMAREESPTSGMFILSPLPVTMGDEDESFADDLPANAVFVHMASASQEAVPYQPGLINLTGLLQFGAQQEADGRVSTVRLLLDPALSQEIVKHTSQHQASNN